MSTVPVPLAGSQTSALCILPPELIFLITTHLPFLCTLTLRNTCRTLQRIIPPATQAQLLHAEVAYADSLNFCYLACASCLRLRRACKFDSQKVKSCWCVNGTKARFRFCLDCGKRPLPLPLRVGGPEKRDHDPFRYQLGQRWEEDKVRFVRCVDCEKIGKVSLFAKLKICVQCYKIKVKQAARDEEERRREWVGITAEEEIQRRLEREDSDVDFGCDDMSLF